MLSHCVFLLLCVFLVRGNNFISNCYTKTSDNCEDTKYTIFGSFYTCELGSRPTGQNLRRPVPSCGAFSPDDEDLFKTKRVFDKYNKHYVIENGTAFTVDTDGTKYEIVLKENYTPTELAIDHERDVLFILASLPETPGGLFAVKTNPMSVNHENKIIIPKMEDLGERYSSISSDQNSIYLTASDTGATLILKRNAMDPCSPITYRKKIFEKKLKDHSEQLMSIFEDAITDKGYRANGESDLNAKIIQLQNELHVIKTKHKGLMNVLFAVRPPPIYPQRRPIEGTICVPKYHYQSLMFQINDQRMDLDSCGRMMEEMRQTFGNIDVY